MSYIKYLMVMNLLLVITVTSVHAAQPDKSWLQSDMQFCGATLKEFVSAGLKKGRWEKNSNKSWMYIYNDGPGGGISASKSSIKSVAIEFERFDSDTVRIISGYEDGRKAYIDNFYDRVCHNLPTVKNKKIREEIEYAERLKKQELEKNKYYQRKLLGSYLALNLGASEQSSMKSVTINSINSSSSGFEYISKYKDNVICKINVINADVKQSDNDFILLATKGKCEIKLEARVPEYDHDLRENIETMININYRGECSEYCNFNQTYKPDSSDPLYMSGYDYQSYFFPSENNFQDIKVLEIKNKQKSLIKDEQWK